MHSPYSWVKDLPSPNLLCHRGSTLGATELEERR